MAETAPQPPRLVFDEDGDRQLVLMALAHLAVERPGFDYALNKIAMNIDNVVDGRAKLYDQFIALAVRDGGSGG